MADAPETPETLALAWLDKQSPELKSKIDTILNNMHKDIMDIIQEEKPVPASSAAGSPASPPEASNNDSGGSSSGNSNVPGGNISNAFGGSGSGSSGSSDSSSVSDSGSDSNSGSGSTFWKDLWGKRQGDLGGSVWSGMKKGALGGAGVGLATGGLGGALTGGLLGGIGGGLYGAGKHLWGSGNNASLGKAQSLSDKLAYGAGGLKRKFDDSSLGKNFRLGHKYSGRKWESYCSDKIIDILFKEDCQYYFQLFNENKKVSLNDYANTSGPINYYIEETLYTYLSELNWSNTFLENLPPNAYEPTGVTPISGTASPAATPEPPKAAIDPLDELKQKIMARIGKYRAQIASLLRDYAAELAAAPAEPAAPAAASAAVPEKKTNTTRKRKSKQVEPEAQAQATQDQAPPKVYTGQEIL